MRDRFCLKAKLGIWVISGIGTRSDLSREPKLDEDAIQMVGHWDFGVGGNEDMSLSMEGLWVCTGLFEFLDMLDIMRMR